MNGRDRPMRRSWALRRSRSRSRSRTRCACRTNALTCMDETTIRLVTSLLLVDNGVSYEANYHAKTGAKIRPGKYAIVFDSLCSNTIASQKKGERGHYVHG